MSEPILSNSNFNIVRISMRVMVFIGLIAMGYVILQSCSVPKNDLQRFAKGSLKKLEIIDPAPVQPKRSFSAQDGSMVSLHDFRGQYVLLNVWATWCTPCIAEIPSLEKLQAEYANLNVIAVSMDRHMVDAASFYKTANIKHLKLYHDSELSMARDVGVDGLPISILYSKTGVELARIPGDVDWQSEDVKAFLAKILL